MFDFEIKDIYLKNGSVSEVYVGNIWYTIDKLFENGR